MGSANSSSHVIKRSNLICVKDLAKQLFVDSRIGLDHSAYKLKNSNPSLKIIDSSAGGQDALKAFKEKAIPTSRFINVIEDLKDPNGRFPNTFPQPNTVKDVLQSIGIEKDDHIVLYSQEGKTAGATRSFFILNSYGFNVKLLNGGLFKYIAEGYPTEKGKIYTGESTKISGLADPSDSLITMSEIQEFEKGNSDFQLIDLRPTEDFNGESEENIEGCREGRVEGAINIHTSEILNEDFTFKTEKELGDLIDKHNLDPKKHTVVMCRTGVAASVGFAAIHSVSSIPFEKVQLYDGGWSEYGSLN